MRKLIAAMSLALLLAGCGEEAQKKAVVVDKWAEWEANPEPYGGLEVLAKIKAAKESGATKLDLSDNQISDVSPLKELTNLGKLDLRYNKITDVSPLAGLTNLEALVLDDNQISDDQKSMLKKALPNCKIHYSIETSEEVPF